MKTVRRSNMVIPSIFEGLFTENRLDVPNYEKFSIPAVNISEKSTNFVIEIAIPGIDKENIAIEVEENILKVSSKTSDQTPAEDTIEEDVKFTRKEFHYGSFERSFTLPETINVENIDASYNAGILAITLPKMEEKNALKKMVEIS
ncbi:MAG: Hsp20/alpha crystallin family protein [Marinirhabdus sp.]|nr:Hsp20/alpha crystallin family protein [Marinirhabdus sp.]